MPEETPPEPAAPTAPEVGSAERPLRVAIVGAGPSGFYTAAALLAAARTDDTGPTVSIDVFDRLPAPYGLVRYGVAPDHPKIKAVDRVFEKLCLDPRVRFLGNVELGRDLSREDLLAHFDQVVYAVGGQSDRRLGIPGEDLAGSHSSTGFVAWYSGHPDFLDLEVDLSCEAAAVVGIGNVAMDVARILARSADDLAATDIADHALEVLRGSRVRDVYVLARRGPVQAKCSPPELKELGEIEGAGVVVDGTDLALDPLSAREAEEDRQAKKNLELLAAYAGADGGSPRRRIHLRFLVSPVEILGEDGKVTGIVVERTRLEDAGGGRLRAVGTGRTETLPVGLVVRAVGYRSLPLPELPFDDRSGIIPNVKGRIVDPATGSPLPREYVVGWVKRGPTGLIGSNKPDGVETAAAMLEDLPALDPVPAEAAAPAAIDSLLAARGARPVPFCDWQRLDTLEVERGRPHGRPRVKFVRVADMLAALDDGGA
jgi:ferredoxin--NADP+ reductase